MWVRQTSLPTSWSRHRAPSCSTADLLRLLQLIEANVQKLGFKLGDVKFILSSHEHLDHAGGISELRRATGAKFVALEQEVPGLTAGTSFPVANPDRVIHDGETVQVGSVIMTAHLTAGHTRGCTTWTTTVRDGGRSYSVVFVGSASVLPRTS